MLASSVVRSIVLPQAIAIGGQSTAPQTSSLITTEDGDLIVTESGDQLTT